MCGSLVATAPALHISLPRLAHIHTSGLTFHCFLLCCCAVFRDDLVFLVYLYQRWIYRVDKKRANEFGYAEEQGEEVEQQEGEQQQLADTPAPADEQVASGSDAAAPKPRARARGKAARGKEEEEEEVGEEAEEKKEL